MPSHFITQSIPNFTLYVTNNFSSSKSILPINLILSSHHLNKELVIKYILPALHSSKIPLNTLTGRPGGLFVPKETRRAFPPR
jgi:hypothetical protein